MYQNQVIQDNDITWKVKNISEYTGGSGGSGGSVGNIPLATKDNDGLMAKEDKEKLDSIYINASGSIASKSGRYGLRIDKRNSDPATRCEYIFDAEGMGPVGMDFTNGVFNYGDWGDIWFVKDNKPCMMLNDGTIDYYLDPDDVTKKEDGTASDVANTSYAGNAMTNLPLGWVKRWEDGRYLYEVVSKTQFDDDYLPYAHVDASGNVRDNFYWSMYPASGSASRLRSLSGQTVSKSLTTAQQITGAIANGNDWYIHSWSQRAYINTLLMLMGKSTDTQSVYGYGRAYGSSGDGTVATGTANTVGQFFGYNSNSGTVKCFNIEHLWGNQWDRTAGLLTINGKYYIKMTPEGDGYNMDGTGYDNTGLTAPSGSRTYINGMVCNKYGMIPSLASGTTSTYWTDVYYLTASGTMYLVVGGHTNFSSAEVGAFAFRVDNAASDAYWYVGCGLSR